MSEFSTEILLEELKRCVAFRSASRFERWTRRPWQMFYSKLSNKLNAVLYARTRTFYGSDIRVVLPDTVSLNLYRYGFVEEGLTYALIRLLKEGDTFVDIGAHLGYHSLLASRLVGRSGKVISFEPTPRVREVLECNTRDRRNVTVVPFAAWSENTKLVINDLGWQLSGWNSVFEPRLTNDVGPRFGILNRPLTVKPKKIEVEAVALDHYFAEFDVRPSFVKIDAESAEFDILRGMENTLRSHHPALSIEVGDFDLKEVLSSREIVEYVKNLDYQALEFDSWKLLPHVIRERYAYDNIIFVPNG